MATVFLSYDHDDVERAAPIATALEHAGHSVWWDRHIHGGAQYNDEIEAAVEQADAVVVLWSKGSVRSTWVRDEAAEGRDQNKLVPVLLDAVKPPMGFRQFQTIDLSRAGRNPNNSAIRPVLLSIDVVLGTQRAPSPGGKPAAAKRFGQIGRRTTFAGVAAAIAALAALVSWNWLGPRGMPVVVVAPADSTVRSRALSNDLFVKLGTFAHVGASKWRLVETASASSGADLMFQVAETGTPAQPQASLALLDGKQDGLLWSRTFAQPDNTEADLRLQLSLAAGIALVCALEARGGGELTADLFKRYLAGCAEAAVISESEPDKTVGVMRSIIAEQPRFKAAWAQLLMAQANALAKAQIVQSGVADTRRTLVQDIADARKVDPDMPEIKLVEIDLLSPFDYGEALKRLGHAKAQAPDKAIIWNLESHLLMGVGRMTEAVGSARRAAELDPLAPSATRQLIMTLAHGGQIDLAREELRRAERKWAGTGTLRDAQWAFHLRYGDPKIARSFWPLPYNEPFYRARENPTPENIEALMRQFKGTPISEFDMGSIQAFGEFHRTAEVFDVLERKSPVDVAKASYVLFRPTLADVRRDPRFISVAHRIGLVRYWRESGIWPDFCYEPNFPYDCRKEAAKLPA